MNRISNKAFSLVLLLFVANILVASDLKEVEIEEQQIWELELNYLKYFQNAAHKKVIPMWHEKFLGWPQSEYSPNKKKEVIGYLKRVAAVPATWKFDIERKGIQVIENVAITHLIQHITFLRSNGSTYKRSTRITHTWVKESGKWRILGGMSSNL